MRVILTCAGALALLLCACQPTGEDIDGGPDDASSSDLGIADLGPDPVR